MKELILEYLNTEDFSLPEILAAIVGCACLGRANEKCTYKQVQHFPHLGRLVVFLKHSEMLFIGGLKRKR